ncbi:unnamed protein product [Linum trigynum]|uniref:MBD domain-containing protein n=1 Tax=Linum trigynum TaxID=586398 RepID=A0AAV2G2X7_9ROSI
MDDGNPDDWLPEGWRVQVNVRKNGKRDKWYFPPTGGAKFYSKLEVTRYLKSNGSGINIGDNEGHTSDDSYNLDTVNNTGSNKNISTIDRSDKFNIRDNITTTTPANTVKHSNNLDLVNITSSNPTSAVGKNTNNVTDSSNHSANSHPKSEEEKEENGTLKRSSKKVTFEKATPEGLPPGWTKEVKVTKKCSKVRRDPYYTDPENAYTFRSMKDVFRYIQTGEVGRLAIRRRQARHHEDTEDDETPSPASAKKQKLGTDTTMNGTNQSLKVPKVEPTGNYQTFKVTKVAPPAPEALLDVQAMQREEIDQTLEATELATTIVSEMLPAKKTVQHEKKEIEATPPEAEGVSDTQPVQQHKVENHETQKHSTTGKSKKKDGVVQLPRRASKRLAALPLEPTTAELEASSSSPQAEAAVKIVDVAIGLDSTSAQKTQSQQHQHRVALVKPTSEPTDPKLQINHLNQNKSEARKASPESNKSKLFGACKKAEEDEAGKLPLDPPLGELWEDPCIAFAIKTLTGSLDDLPLGSNNNGLGDSASTKEHLATPEVSIPEVEPINNSQNPGSPVSLSASYTWADPCIEFAIKTLTGAIPLDSDLFNMQEQATSSQQVQPSSSQVFHHSPTIFPTEAAARVEQLSLPQTKTAWYTGGSSPSAGMGRRVTRSQRKAV